MSPAISPIFKVVSGQIFQSVFQTFLKGFDASFPNHLEKIYRPKRAKKVQSILASYFCVFMLKFPIIKDDLGATNYMVQETFVADFFQPCLCSFIVGFIHECI